MVHYFFPDDTNYATEALNSDIERVRAFSEKHNLLLNMNKSSIILFCSESERYTVEELLNLKIGQVNLKFSDSVKILGLTMESKLSFTGHVKNLRKMYIKLRLLYSNKFILNYKLRKKLCESLIMSLFTYCNGIYFPFLDLQTKNRLQVMQNNCVRFIFGLNISSR